jgi:hypothetical protein
MTRQTALVSTTAIKAVGVTTATASRTDYQP